MTHRKGPKQDNRNKPWTSSEDKRLKKLAKRNTPTGLVADAMGRTKPSIYSRASKKGISLKPTNQSPYGKIK